MPLTRAVRAGRERAGARARAALERAGRTDASTVSVARSPRSDLEASSGPARPAAGRSTRQGEPDPLAVAARRDLARRRASAGSTASSRVAAPEHARSSRARRRDSPRRPASARLARELKARRAATPSARGSRRAPRRLARERGGRLAAPLSRRSPAAARHEHGRPRTRSQRTCRRRARRERSQAQSSRAASLERRRARGRPIAPSGPRTLTVIVDRLLAAAAGRRPASRSGWARRRRPVVIPLGTRMTIPGYGEGVAADTGGADHGSDDRPLVPDLAQALAWGRRTVTITLH